MIYHNAQCCKSNAALNLLLDHDIDTDIVSYLETPLTSGQLKILLSQLDREAKALIRFSEPVAAELGLSVADIRDENDWINFMVKHPILIERPIIVIENRAVIGRPPETLLALLQND